jgi:ankyrin repeat protein
MTDVSAGDELDEIFEILATGGPSDFEFVKALVADFPNGKDGRFGRHWIRNAIDSGSLTAVRWMIEDGVNVRFRDGEGLTALHAPMERGCFERHEMMRALIAAGADVNAFGTNGWAPLHMAAFINDIEAVKILLAAGADQSLRTQSDDYTTPEQEATSDEAASLIRNYQPPPPQHDQKC